MQVVTQANTETVNIEKYDSIKFATGARQAGMEKLIATRVLRNNTTDRITLVSYNPDTQAGECQRHWEDFKAWIASGGQGLYDFSVPLAEVVTEGEETTEISPPEMPPVPELNFDEDTDAAPQETDDSAAEAEAEPPRRRRGRPRKTDNGNAEGEEAETADSAD